MIFGQGCHKNCISLKGAVAIKRLMSAGLCNVLVISALFMCMPIFMRVYVCGVEVCIKHANLSQLLLFFIDNIINLYIDVSLRLTMLYLQVQKIPSF